MEQDPDYIDPAVLKRRSAESGGAGAVSSRPLRRDVEDEAVGVTGVRISRTTARFEHLRVSGTLNAERAQRVEFTR